MKFKVMSIHTDYIKEDVTFKTNECVELDTSTMSKAIRMTIIEGIVSNDLVACDCNNGVCLNETNKLLSMLITNIL